MVPVQFQQQFIWFQSKLFNQNMHTPATHIRRLGALFILNLSSNQYQYFWRRNVHWFLSSTYCRLLRHWVSECIVHSQVRLCCILLSLSCCDQIGLYHASPMIIDSLENDDLWVDFYRRKCENFYKAKSISRKLIWFMDVNPLKLHKAVLNAFVRKASY